MKRTDFLSIVHGMVMFYAVSSVAKIEEEHIQKELFTTEKVVEVDEKMENNKALTQEELVCDEIFREKDTMAETVPTKEELFRSALELPVTEIISPIAQYVTVVQTGNLIIISGQLPRRPDFAIVKGKLGSTLSVEQGYYAAHLCALAIVAHLKAKIGDLSRVRRCVKLTGYINATSEFTDHSLVMNGASDVMMQFFGEAGKHARATVGVTSLPLGSAVEVEAIFEVA